MRRAHSRHWTTVILAVLVALTTSCGRDSVSDVTDQAEQLRLEQELAREQARIAQLQLQDRSAFDSQIRDSGSGSAGDAPADIIGNLLYCSPQRYGADVKIIGRDGGELRIGRHRLKIPAGALSKNTVITGEAPADALVSIILLPHGLQFAKPVKLTLDYDHCGETVRNKKIVQINELLQILEYQRSLDYEEYEYIDGWLNHFSKYGMAEN